MTTQSFRNLVKTRLGAISLFCILLATFTHTATFMSQFFYNNILLGGIAAFAIDAGVIAMAFYKDQLQEKGELGGMVRAVTILVLLASGVANMSEGFLSAHGVQLSATALKAVDWVDLVKWGFGTIIFPILAYIMTDTIGSATIKAELNNHKRNQKKKQRQERPAAVQTSEPRLKVIQGGQAAGRPARKRKTDPMAKANAGRKLSRAQKVEKVQAYLQQHGYTSLRKIAEETGVKKTTVGEIIRELKEAV